MCSRPCLPDMFLTISVLEFPPVLRHRKTPPGIPRFSIFMRWRMMRKVCHRCRLHQSVDILTLREQRRPPPLTPSLWEGRTRQRPGRADYLDSRTVVFPRLPAANTEDFKFLELDRHALAPSPSLRLDSPGGRVSICGAMAAWHRLRRLQLNFAAIAAWHRALLLLDVVWGTAGILSVGLLP